MLQPNPQPRPGRRQASVLLPLECYHLLLFANDVIAQISANIRSGVYTMARSAAIGIRVEPEIKAAAERVAAKDRRTLASLVEKVLVEWLEANGHLSGPENS